MAGRMAPVGVGIGGAIVLLFSLWRAVPADRSGEPGSVGNPSRRIEIRKNPERETEAEPGRPAEVASVVSLPSPAGAAGPAELEASEDPSEVEAEARWWKIMIDLRGEAERGTPDELRREVLHVTAEYLGFHGEEARLFGDVVERALAELLQAEREREAARMGIPEFAEESVRAQLEAEIEERYLEQREAALSRLVKMVGANERGRRFCAGRLEEWVDELNSELP